MISVRAILSGLIGDRNANQQVLDAMNMQSRQFMYKPNPTDMLKIAAHSGVVQYLTRLIDLLQKQATVDDYIASEIMRLQLNIANCTKDIQQARQDETATDKLEELLAIGRTWQIELNVLERLKNGISSKISM